MPLTTKGSKVRASMRKNYGKEKGDAVFYAWMKKRKPKGMERRGNIPEADIERLNPMH